MEEMNCAELDILICDYVDGALNSTARAAVESHLAGCGSCQALVDDSRAVLSFLEGVPAVEPPPQLITRIINEVPAAEGRDERRSGRMAARLDEADDATAPGDGDGDDDSVIFDVGAVHGTSEATEAIGFGSGKSVGSGGR